MVLVRPDTYWVSAKTDDGQRSDRQRVEVPAVGKAPCIELRVRPAGAIRGEVFTDRCERVQSAQVSLYDMGSTPPKPAGGATPDSEGRFSVSALEPGTYLVYAEATDLDGIRRAVVRKAFVQAGSESELELPTELGTEVLAVVAGANHDPVGGARVAVERVDGAPVALRLTRSRMALSLIRRWREENTRFATLEEAHKARLAVLRRLNLTDAGGRLATWSLLPGDYVITATAPGHKPWKKTVRITSGGKQAVEIVLEKE
jgi:hypothetical protein